MPRGTLPNHQPRRCVVNLLLGLMLLCADLAPQPRPANFDPPAVLQPKSGVAYYVPPADVKEVEYIALDGEEPFPVSVIGGNPTAFVFLTRGLPEKNYRFIGVASDSTGKLTRRPFVVPVGNPTTPAPKDPPTTPVPKDPPGKTAYFFLIVRPDGPAAPAFTKNMALPAWDTLRAQGHLVGDKSVTDAKAWVSIPAGTTLPVVVTFREDEANSYEVRGPIALPDTNAAILKLPEGVK